MPAYLVDLIRADAASSGAPSAPTAVAGSSADPFSYPLSNGFPSTELSNGTIESIQQQAHGTLPNGPPPTSLADNDITSLELIAFNEIFEVAYFTSLLYNITNKVSGYEASTPAEYDALVAAITAVQGQEQLHALSANGAVTAFNHPAIGGCQYQFPVTNLNDSLSLARTFTDVVVGTLANAQLLAAQAGDSALVPLIGSIIAQEGEQNGFYRSEIGLIPSALPFLTAVSRPFAFSALNQVFVVPGSCDAAVAQVGLPIFAPLTVSPAAPSAQTQTLTFTTTDDVISSAKALVYINQQNVPIVTQIVNSGNGTITANFPYEENEMNGLTIAALVSTEGPFASADEVANVTVAGPGLIEIN